MSGSELKLRNVDNGSLMRLGFVTGLCFWGLVGLAFAIAALFGANTVRINGVPITGIWALPASAFIALIFTFVHMLAVAFGGAMARSFPKTGDVVIRKRVKNEPLGPSAS